MAEAVTGNQRPLFGLGDKSDILYNTLAFGCKKAGIPILARDKLESLCEEMNLEEMARASQFICREVVLDVNWHRFDCGVLIANLNQSPVVCYPTNGKYRVFNQTTGEDKPLNKVLLGQLEPKAWTLRRTLPKQKVGKKEIFHFVKKSFHKRDIISLTLLGIISTLIGVLQPKLNQLIYDEYQREIRNMYKRQKDLIDIRIVADKDSLIEYLTTNWVDEVYIDSIVLDRMSQDMINEIMGMGITVHFALDQIENVEARHKHVEWVCGSLVIPYSEVHLPGIG